MRTPVVNLGETGLAGLDGDGNPLLALRLYSGADAAPATLDASGLTVHELGNGDYWLDGVDLAPGASAVLFVARAASPELALVRIDLASPAPTIVVYRDEVTFDPRGPFKQGDGASVIAVRIPGGLPVSVADPAARAYFSMRRTRQAPDPAASPSNTVNLAAAALAPFLDNSSSTYGCDLTYGFTPEDLAQAGQYIAEFRIDLPSGGSPFHVPRRGWLDVSVVASLEIA